MADYHVLVLTHDGYIQKREPFRVSHLERLKKLRDEGRVLCAGPFPDGKGVDLVYRLKDEAELKAVVESDPYWTGGVWKSWTFKAFKTVVGPKSAVPVVTDGSRKVAIVEGQASGAAMRSLETLAAEGRVHVGGVLKDGGLWALTSGDEQAAPGWLKDAGAGLSARPLFYVL